MTDEAISSSGLKRRTPKKTSGFKAITKPRKMDLVRRNRLSGKTDNYANPATLVFPTDPLGLTSNLKKEMLAITSRVAGNASNYKVFAETMEVLAKHLEARCAQAEDNAGKQLKRRSADPAPEELTEGDETSDDESSTEDETTNPEGSGAETEVSEEQTEEVTEEPAKEESTQPKKMQKKAAPKKATKKKTQPKTKAKGKK